MSALSLRCLLMSLKNCLCNMSRVYIFIAEGFECVEAMAAIDVLNRAGVELCRVAVGDSLEVASSHGLMSLRCDVMLGETNISDGVALVLPGGNPGYINLCESEDVRRAVAEYYKSDRIVAAICGAPTVLARAGVAKGTIITCHSSVKSVLTDYEYRADGVVESGNLITASGAGHSIDFALAIAARLVDATTLAAVRKGMEL